MLIVNNKASWGTADMKMKKNFKQSGFTLVELIVVIIILAILGAVALPKFIDVTERAQISAVKGAAGGLGAGVALYHAQWVANGHTSATPDIDGFGGAGVTNTVDSNGNGWPIGTGYTAATGAGTPNTTAAECLNTWQNVFQSGGPPAATAAASGIDYVAANSGTECQYTYYGGSATVPAIDFDDDGTSAAVRIDYDTADGSVVISGG